MTKKPGAAKSASKTPAKKAVASKAAAPKPRAAKAVKVANGTRQAAKPLEKPAAKPKAEKVKKPKLVRDSFTMPEQEYALLAQLKKTCLAAGIDIKKSELLRIGVAQLASMDAKKLGAAQAALTPLKAGRPKKHK